MRVLTLILLLPIVAFGESPDMASPESTRLDALRYRRDALIIHLQALEHSFYVSQAKYIVRVVRSDYEKETIEWLKEPGHHVGADLTPTATIKAIHDAIASRVREVELEAVLIERQLAKLTNAVPPVVEQVEILTSDTMETVRRHLRDSENAANNQMQNIGTNAPNSDL